MFTAAEKEAIAKNRLKAEIMKKMKGSSKATIDPKQGDEATGFEEV